MTWLAILVPCVFSVGFLAGVVWRSSVGRWHGE